MDELLVPPDLPIEMIAEEVKESWRLKEVHVEKLMQKVSLSCHPSLFCGHETHRSLVAGGLDVSSRVLVLIAQDMCGAAKVVLGTDTHSTACYQ